MATKKREFLVKTSREAGKKQRDNICILGGQVFSLKTYIGNHLVCDPSMKKKINQKLLVIDKLLTKIDKHDQAIWHEILEDKNNLPKT